MNGGARDKIQCDERVVRGGNVGEGTVDGTNSESRWKYGHGVTNPSENRLEWSVIGFRLALDVEPSQTGEATSKHNALLREMAAIQTIGESPVPVIDMLVKAADVLNADMDENVVKEFARLFLLASSVEPNYHFIVEAFFPQVEKMEQRLLKALKKVFTNVQYEEFISAIHILRRERDFGNG